MRDPKDQALLERLQSGEEQALSDLADAYGSKIYQLAFRYLRNKEDAEEITQDVLYKVFRSVGAFRGDAALSSWIYRITFNTAMSRLRHERSARLASEERDRALARIESGDDLRPAPREAADWSHMPDEELLRVQLRDAFDAAVADLPEIYRVPVVLRDIEGLSTEEASSRLHVKDQTLKSRLHRGRLMLRSKLQAFTSGLNLHRPTPAFS